MEVIKMRSNGKIGVLIAAALFASTALPVSAHHAFAAEFDSNKPMTLTGVVAKVNWQNPHVYVYLDVKETNGSTTTYALECNSVNTLVHKGWTRDALKKGDKVTVSAFGPKDTRPLPDGSIHANARSITLANGTNVSAGSSAGEAVK
jgi:hypothetical protein